MAMLGGLILVSDAKLQKEFLVSYAGEVEYRIGGVRYAVRYFGNTRMAYNGDYFERTIKKLIGTVRVDDMGRRHEFPPREVVALFPGFVGARFSESWEVEYDGPAPVVRPGRTIKEYLFTDASESAE